MTPPSSVRHLPASAARRVRWRNGLGWTRELHLAPDPDAWTWRLSIAEIDQTAPFSSFPGVERVLVLLDGDGVRLDFGDGTSATLAQPWALHRFAGEQEVTGVLLGGPTRDFNLMWRRDAVDAQLELLPISGASSLAVAPKEEAVLHLLEGRAQLGGVTLSPGDCAVLEAAPTSGTYALEGTGTALWIRVTPR